MSRFLGVFVVLSVAGCPAPTPGLGGPAPVEALPVPLPSEGFQLHMKMTVPPGEEAWRCEIVPRLDVDGDVFSYVSHAESRQTAGMHHADVATLFFTGLQLAPGQYDCADLYSQHTELMEDAVTIYASQNPDDSLTLPDGVAAQLPIDSLYMFEMHYVNVSDQPIEAESFINAYTMNPDDVEETIYGAANRDFDINVPAGAVDHVEWTRCVFNQDVDIIFLSGHTHELATNFTLRLFDGVDVGDVVYENDDWHAPPVVRYDPPLRVLAGTGFEYTCNYTSTRDSETVWGFNATDEMCQFGYVFTPGDTSITCATVSTSDGLGVP